MAEPGPAAASGEPEPGGASGQPATARARLEAARAATRVRLAALRASRADVVAAAAGANIDDEHDPEGATLGFERAQVQALASRAERQLADIEAALVRVTAGTYGRCEMCGEPIAPAPVGRPPDGDDLHRLRRSPMTAPFLSETEAGSAVHRRRRTARVEGPT